MVRLGLLVWDVPSSSGIDVWCLIRRLASLGRCLWPNCSLTSLCDCCQYPAEEVSSGFAETNANLGLFAVVDALSEAVRQANDLIE